MSNLNVAQSRPVCLHLLNVFKHTHTWHGNCCCSSQFFHYGKLLEQEGGDRQRNKSGIKIRPIKAAMKNIYKSPQIKQDGLILFAILSHLKNTRKRTHIFIFDVCVCVNGQHLLKSFD